MKGEMLRDAKKCRIAMACALRTFLMRFAPKATKKLRNQRFFSFTKRNVHRSSVFRFKMEARAVVSSPFAVKRSINGGTKRVFNVEAPLPATVGSSYGAQKFPDFSAGPDFFHNAMPAIDKE